MYELYTRESTITYRLRLLFGFVQKPFNGHACHFPWQRVNMVPFQQTKSRIMHEEIMRKNTRPPNVKISK